MKKALLGLTLSAVILSACQPATRDNANVKGVGANDNIGSNENGSQKQIVIRSDFKAGEVAALCAVALKKAKDGFDKIVQEAKINTTNKNFATTTAAVDKVAADFGDDVTPLTFMGYVSNDATVRAEGADCEDQQGQFNVAQFSRRDLYDAIKDVKPGNADEARLQDQMMLAFEKNGLKLSAEKLDQVRALQQQIAQLSTKFSKNLNEDTTTVTFTKQELDGMSQDFMARLKQDAAGNYIVTTKETDYSAVMTEAKDPETRHKILMAYLNRAPGNSQILNQAVALRAQTASIMGYNTWADYRIKGNMADTASNVMTLLTSLKGKLAERNKSDLAKLLEEKKKIADPQAKVIDPWDVGFMANEIKKSEYNVDGNVVRGYFPKDVVMTGLFEVYSTMLGVRFEEVKNAQVWSPEVKLYAIKNKGSDETAIGYFYTDFFPRPGKYGHAAAFPLISGRALSSGKYSVPVSAIVANLTPPTPATGGNPAKPSLMSHDEVQTVFHEFGHIMHQTLTRAPYAWLSGSSVAQDFVEAPSQMLENWVWDANILNKLSGLYTDPTKKLPADLLKQMLAAKDFNQGYFYTRQLTLGLTDMAIHMTNGPVDVDQVYDQTYKETLGLEPVKGGHFMAGFGHLMGGYDAGYYGYLWSEVYAADMFTIFRDSGDLMSPVVGKHYRDTILEKGNMIPALDLVTLFLGRAPSPDAFYKKLGINP